MPRILLFNSDYPPFLESLYARHVDLTDAPYARQMKARNDSLFGVADFFSRSFENLGWEAFDIHINNANLQRAWMRENGLPIRVPRSTNGFGERVLRKAGRLIPGIATLAQDAGWMHRVVAAQIRHFHPDVLFNMEMNDLPPAFLRQVKEDCRLLVGLNAAPLSADHGYSCYDLVVSSLPNVVARFRALGVEAEYWPLAFEPTILDALAAEEPAEPLEVVFFGSISRHHRRRLELLEYLCARRHIDVRIPSTRGLPKDSPIRKYRQPPLWGVDMFRRLAASRIALNCHIDMAGGYANNMRLYEATGVGTLLLTDRKSNLADLFEPEREVVTYASPEECGERIAYFLEHDNERAAIAAAGQRRTLADHTVAARIRELADMLDKRL